VATKCGCLLKIKAESGTIGQVISPGLQNLNRVIQSPHSNPGGIHSIAMNPSGKYLATGAAESTLFSVLCAKTFGPVQHFKVSHSLLR